MERPLRLFEQCAEGATWSSGAEERSKLVCTGESMRYDFRKAFLHRQGVSSGRKLAMTLSEVK